MTALYKLAFLAKTCSTVIKKSATEEVGIQFSFIILLNHGCHILYVNKNKYKI